MVSEQTAGLQIIGHRGAHGLAPENTLKGFAKALEYDIDQIETDIKITKDGVPVLQHELNGRFRLPDGEFVRVNDYSYQELLERAPDMPTLAAGIEFVNRRARLMLDIRGVEPGPIIELLRHYLAKGWQPSDFMINSDSYAILKMFLDELPDIDRIVQGNWSGVRVQYLARKLHTPYILLDQRYLWWGYVKLVSKRYKLVTYTFLWWEKEPFFNHHKARKWAKYGLWGIVTDYPDYYAKKVTS